MNLKIHTNNNLFGLDSEIMEFAKNNPDSKIRIMPDYHKGKGCVIGTTMTLTDRVNPNVVGVDISCGVSSMVFSTLRNVDLEWLDKIIKEKVPTGFNVHNSAKENDNIAFLDDLIADYKEIGTTKEYVMNSIGTLGGGNHFIELGKASDGKYMLSVHSGSRNLGMKIASHYASKSDSDGNITGKVFEDYLNDMKIVQEYARVNRATILFSIFNEIKRMQFVEFDTIINSVHNYIDTDDMILRKGAISAKKGEVLVIPMNMKDGILVCLGLGNDDWNQSAPHGAGRTKSRGMAKKEIKLEDFEKDMEGIYSSSVNKSTLDEAPTAYKPYKEIVDAIDGVTVKVMQIVKPVYSHKG